MNSAKDGERSSSELQGTREQCVLRLASFCAVSLLCCYPRELSWPLVSN